MKTLSFLSALVAVCAVNAAQVSEVKVRALDGFGGDVGSVVSRCQTKAGAEYDPMAVSRDVTALKDSGEFEDIRVDAQPTAGGGQIEVTFFVKRKFRYHAPVQVVGASEFSESKIASEAGLKDGYLYGEGDLAAAAEKVRAAYQKKGYPDVKVMPRFDQFGGGNDAHVVFTISEGGESEVRDFTFVGVKSVEENELREAIGDFPWWNWNGWFSTSPESDEQLAQCVAKIESVYRNHGFLDVKVSKPERIPVAEKPGKCDVLFAVAEGDQYKVGKSSIKGLTRYPEEAVKTLSKLPEAGEIAGLKTLQDAADRVRIAVGSAPDQKGAVGSGLADTRVDIRRIPSESDPLTLDIVYLVKEGVPVVIDDVIIRGNDYTKDKVVRREIPLGPGDSMDERRAERGKRRLENLDYFSRVRYYLEPSGRGVDENGAEYRNLVYEIDEKNTGSFMVGLGASSVDSVYISAEVSQSNFDLFAPGKLFRGGGQKARAYVQWGPRIQTIEASITEPHLFDRYLELTVEGYRRGRWYDEYDLYRNGAAATLSYPVKFWPSWDPFGRLGFRLSGEFIQMDDVDFGEYYYQNSYGRYFLDQESQYGDAMEGVVRVFWSHNNCDNYRTPSSGGRSNVFVDLAGGDNSWWRLGLSHRQYFPVWKRFNHVLMVAARLETIDSFSDEVPVYNRMFLGGPRTIRGIKYRNVSPLARRGEYSSVYAPIGGQTLFCMNFEYTIPIVKMLRLAVFSDLGAIGMDEFDFSFSDTFAWTVGLGLRLDIPMFPIRLDFATPIEKPDEAEEEVFSFTVGYDF